MLEGLPLERGKPSEIPAPSERSRAHAEALGAQVAREEGIPFLSVAELRALQEKSADRTLYLLDVRLAPEFAEGHIPGAISIPGGQAAQRTDEVIAVRSGKVVTYCDKNARAVMAAYWLRGMGLDASVLRGGLGAWREAGEAVVQARAAPSGESPAGAEDVLQLDEARRMARAHGPREGLVREMDVILEVGSSASFERGHLEGAKWTPRGWLEERACARVREKGAAVLCVCENGERSALSAWALQRLGYPNAGYLEGGKEAWRAAGLPLEAGRAGMDEEPKDVQRKPYDIGRGAMEGYLAWEEELGRKYARE